MGTGAGTRVLAVGLIALMALGSVFLWLGIPFLWIYGASQMVESSQPSLGPYVLVLFGIPISMVLVGKALSRLNRVYGDVTGTTPTVKVRTPWLRSMRGERDTDRPRTILDVVMVISVSVALALFGLWFLFFAEGGGLPGQ
ncbi:hypothetical protein [Conexibacter sp. SYSU D00693]|uniref:hypothetical protein n=1 Tax=Conexibacter sp. SYSU D00693 TaxID=2812560 RepID=UPI00196B2BAD|nr:hypothetical protein [Conexibacter sp. SYSU D00693]